MCGEGGGRERLAGLLSGYKRLPPEFIGKRTLRPSAAERSTFRHCWYYAVGVCSLLHSLLSHIHATGKHSAREYSAQRRESKLAGTIAFIWPTTEDGVSRSSLPLSACCFFSISVGQLLAVVLTRTARSLSLSLVYSKVSNQS
jgi:hypothetical protein